jgi:hypothetical protein
VHQVFSFLLAVTTTAVSVSIPLSYQQTEKKGKYVKQSTDTCTSSFNAAAGRRFPRQNLSMEE